MDRIPAPMRTEASIPGFIKVGRIVRAHGLDGEVKIELLQHPADENPFDKITLVYMRNERGDLIPFRLSEVRKEEKRNQTTFFVHFESIADRSEAEAMTQKGLFVESGYADLFTGMDKPDTQPQFEGYGIANASEPGALLGEVTGVINNPAHFILEVELDSGDDLLIPLVDEYIVDIDDENALLLCKNLEQLKF